MVIKLEGKVRRTGKSSKTGRDYDFGTLYFLYPERGVDGMAAVGKLVDPFNVDLDKLVVGQYYNLDIDLNGNITGVTPAKP